MGLPIDGMPTTGLESADPVGVIRTHLNLSESKAKELLKVKKGKECFGNSLIELKKIFEEVPEECHGLSLEPYVKVYLLYLLGQVVFPNTSRTIAAMYLPLLDLQTINDYAWGAAEHGLI
ncbi:hypothetical protein L484_001480 [Morus notabilis]|uniref:Aminotransferase-like plant mobile domain-containing protein n=1 Tax=Morus notabilis TaxID=981085 RepID=W9QWL9_9ROSA|nr:hypothetical protein L484_001480 [Morus notabilis]